MGRIFIYIYVFRGGWLLHKLFLISIQIWGRLFKSSLLCKEGKRGGKADILKGTYLSSLCLVLAFRKERNERILNVVARRREFRRQNLRGLLRILELHFEQVETQVCKLDEVDEDFLLATPKQHTVPLVESQRVIFE